MSVQVLQKRNWASPISIYNSAEINKIHEFAKAQRGGIILQKRDRGMCRQIRNTQELDFNQSR